MRNTHSQKIFGPLGAGAGAFLLAGASLLSYLLGWGRDAVFARMFGLTAETDAYFKAFLIPDTLLTIFITGALLGLVIPLYTQSKKISLEKASETFGTFFFFFNSIYFFVAIAIFFFLEPLLIFLFPETPKESLPFLLGITKILLFSNFFFALSNFLGHFLLAQKRFISYSFAPLFYNLGIILGMIFFGKSMGIYSAAWGAFFGAFFHFFFRFLDFLITPEKFSFVCNFRNPFLWKLVGSMWPKVISLLSLQIGFYIFARLGDDFLGAGNYSSFQYARNLQSFAVSLFGISIATAVFPFLSEFFAEKKWGDFMYRFEKSLRQILFLAIPSALGMILLSSELVRFTYGSHSNGENIIFVLIPLALTIPFESANHLFVRALHALNHTFLPMVGSLIFLAILIGSSFFLVVEENLGIEGLGISYMISFLIQTIFLFLLLLKYGGIFPWQSFLERVGKTLLLTIFMTACVWLFLVSFEDISFIERLFIGGILGGISYFGGALLLQSPELKELPLKRWFQKIPDSKK